jgi:hypothetical protein
MFRGIIDLDGGNLSSPRIHVLKRHSIENYQLDPIVVFSILIEEKKAPSLPNISVTRGDEHLLRTLPGSVLQSVVDYVAQKIEPALNALTSGDRTPTPVKFTNEVELNYPAWMLNRRGHDLLSVYQGVFGQPIITPPRLEKSFRRVRLVPTELAEIMSQLQKV